MKGEIRLWKFFAAVLTLVLWLAIWQTLWESLKGGLL